MIISGRIFSYQVFVVIIFLLTPVSFTSFGQTTVSCRPKASAFYTGRVNNVLGVYDKTDGEILVGDPYDRRSWAFFDLTSIPPDALVTALTLRIRVTSATTEPVKHTLVLRHFHVDPFSGGTSNPVIWEEIGTNPVIFAKSTTAGDNTGTVDIPLQNFSGHITPGHEIGFAVGFQEENDDANDCAINGWNWSSTPTNQNAEPILYVTYITCSVAVATGSTVTYNSGNKNITVTSNGVTNWIASETSSWVQLTNSEGTGSGTISAEYQQNTSCNARSCVITVTCGSKSDTYVLTQEGKPCVLSVPNGISIPANSGTFNISITSNGCSGWTATETSPWFYLSSTSGSGSGTITVVYQRNTLIDPRSYTILFNCDGSTDSFVINQEGTPITGTEMQENISELRLYPNPTEGELTVEMELLKVEDLVIQITNLNGTVVFERKFSTNIGKFQESINIGYLSKGLYNFRLISSEGITNKKLIIN